MHSLAKMHRQHTEIGIPARPGALLFLEGDTCDRVYELRRGVARGISISEGGHRQITGFFFAGDQIGLPVAPTYRYTAEAVTEILYVRHSVGRWLETLVHTCREECCLHPSIGAEQDSIFHRALILGRTGILVRVCAFLVSVIERLPSCPNGMPILPMPQVDIAAYLATAPESICRAFRCLRERGAVSMPRRDQIVLIDRALIEAIAQGRAAPTSWH